MALPSSGTLSINDIRSYLGSTNGSLRALSNAVGFSTPDKISDFYGYSNTLVVFTPDSGYAYPLGGVNAAFYDTIGVISNNTGSTIYLWLCFNPGATGLYCSNNNSMWAGSPTAVIYMTYGFVAANTNYYSATAYTLGTGNTGNLSIHKYSLQSSVATLRFAYSIGIGGTKVLI
jgi:hypothetical protein